MGPSDNLSPLGKGENSPTLPLAILLAALTLAAFWGIQSHEFVSYDDYHYITENRHVNTGLTARNVVWAFTSVHSFNWHPLTWLSHMVDVELFGLNPAGHHWSSLLLHLANTLLLFLLLRTMTRATWRSAAVAALFAIHPLHVESVAWAAERKDVLSGFFWMTTLLAYVRHVRRPGRASYCLVTLLFACGLMSKPMVVTLPFALLLLDFWPLGRFRTTGRAGEWWLALLRLCREKIPLFALSALSSILTYSIQKGSGAVGSELPLGMRLSNAPVAYVRYIYKMLWPVDLCCFYPHPLDGLRDWQVAGASLLLLSLTFALVRTRKGHPHLLAGWLWYVLTLVPVIGLVQVGIQAMADRYTYIPLIGVFILIVWGITPLFPQRSRPARAAAAALSASLFALLLLLARGQVSHWRDSLSLFRQEVRAHPGSFMARFHLGTALQERGMLREASAEYLESVLIRPGFQLGHYNLANAYAGLGKIPEALIHYSIAIHLDPGDFKSHTNLGILLLRQGRPAEAVHHFSEAIRIHPDDRIARHHLVAALQKLQESATP